MGNFSETFLLVLVSGILGNGFGCSDFKGQRPKILISSTPEHIKFYDRNYTVIIDGIGIEVRFDCWAPYPIDIKFNGHLANRGATVGLIERRVKDPKDISTYCFNINVTLTAYEEITGEYKCHSVENESIASSHYIYHAAHPPETLLNRNSTIRVVMKKNEEWTIIPCPTSNPNVEVHLYKYKNNGQREKLRKDDLIWTYNPRVGFSFNSNYLERATRHTFRCETELSDLDFVEVVLYPSKPVIPNPSQKNLVANEGEQIIVSCKASQKIVFENSNKAIQEGAFVTLVSGQSEDSIYQYTTPVLRKGDSGIISCISASSTEELYEWSFRTIKKAEPQPHPSERSEGSQSQSDNNPKHSLNSYECKLANGEMKIALYECNNWVECNLRKCNNLDRKCESVRCNDQKTSNCIQNGVIQCFNTIGESAQTRIFFSGLHNRKTYTFWKSAPKQSILKIRKYAKSKSKNGTAVKPESSIVDDSEVELACEGSAFIFAVGFKWYLSNKDNTTQVLIPEEKVTHTWKHFDSKNILRSILKINITDESITQVICKAPIWNSTEWREDAYSISQYYKGVLRNPKSSNSGSMKISFVFVIKLLLILLVADK